MTQVPSALYQDTDPEALLYKDQIPETFGEPDIDRFYHDLKRGVTSLIRDYSNLLMLDAAGGLGKTHNIKRMLRDALGPEGATDDRSETGWVYRSGYSTPLGLYELLWQARHNNVVFLDDVSGLTNTKAIDMLKSATDSEGEENWISYDTSKTLSLGENDVDAKQFEFSGRIIISFNDTPSDKHFAALKDRAWLSQAYSFDLSHSQRIDLIKEVAKVPDLVDGLSVEQQYDTALWIEDKAPQTADISIRTLESICRERAMSLLEPDVGDWRRAAISMFDVDYTDELIIDLRKNSDLPISEQIAIVEQEAGIKQSAYYDRLSRIKEDME